MYRDTGTSEDSRASCTRREMLIVMFNRINNVFCLGDRPFAYDVVAGQSRMSTMRQMTGEVLPNPYMPFLGLLWTSCINHYGCPGDSGS